MFCYLPFGDCSCNSCKAKATTASPLGPVFNHATCLQRDVFMSLAPVDGGMLVMEGREKERFAWGSVARARASDKIISEKSNPRTFTCKHKPRQKICAAYFFASNFT